MDLVIISLNPDVHIEEVGIYFIIGIWLDFIGYNSTRIGFPWGVPPVFFPCHTTNYGLCGSKIPWTLPGNSEKVWKVSRTNRRFSCFFAYLFMVSSISIIVHDFSYIYSWFIYTYMYRYSWFLVYCSGFFQEFENITHGLFSKSLIAIHDRTRTDDISRKLLGAQPGRRQPGNWTHPQSYSCKYER